MVISCSFQQDKYLWKPFPDDWKRLKVCGRLAVNHSLHFFSKHLASSVLLAGCCQEKQLFVHSPHHAGWALALIYLVSAPCEGNLAWEFRIDENTSLLVLPRKPPAKGLMFWSVSGAVLLLLAGCLQFFLGNSWLFSMNENNRTRPYIFLQSYLKLN